MTRLALTVPLSVPLTLPLTVLLAALSTQASAARLAPAEAADWPKLEGLPFSQRLSVTVENTSDAALPAALVHLPLADLAKLLPDAKPGQLAVTDSAPVTPKPKRDAADANFIPSQESDNTLIFSVALQPHEKKSLFIYTTPAPAGLPGFATGTGYDSRHAYRSFENRYAAFRIETGPGSNTTGMAIDLFGKTRAGIGLRLAELYQQGHDAYHNLQYWGVDILKVDKGPGLAGLYVFSGDPTSTDAGVRPPYAAIQSTCLYSGPVETKLQFTAPVEVAGKKYTVTRHLTLVANDRSLRDDVTISGDGAESLTLGVGLRDLPNCTWSEDPKAGTAFQAGDANQPHYKAVALGLAFDPKSYLKTLDLPDKKDFGHVYLLKLLPTPKGGESHHRLLDLWDMDGQLPAPVSTAAELQAPMQAFLSTYTAERDHPLQLTLAPSAESRP